MNSLGVQKRLLPFPMVRRDPAEQRCCSTSCRPSVLCSPVSAERGWAQVLPLRFSVAQLLPSPSCLPSMTSAAYREPRPHHLQHVPLSWGNRGVSKCSSCRPGAGESWLSPEGAKGVGNISLSWSLHSVEGIHSRIAQSHCIPHFREVISMCTYCFSHPPDPA